MGVTGERSSLGEAALGLAGRCKEESDAPVLVGVGVSNAEQARQVVAVADGVVVGSALVHRLLEGAGPDGRRLSWPSSGLPSTAERAGIDS